MDLFDKYFKELAAGAADTPWHGQMAQLVAARTMLAYPEHRNRTLRYLAKLLWRMGRFGEAYQAAWVLPPEELGDCADIVKAAEYYGLSKKLNTTIEIITKCNLRCPLCTAREDGGYKPNDKQIMPFKTFQKIWNRVAQYTNFAILVGQGETFLHPQIYDILNYIKPIPVHIDTNASLNLDHDRIVQSSIHTLIFSVDGVDQRTYEQYRVGGHFNKVIENIKAAVSAKKKYGRGPIIVFKYIVFRHNEAYVAEASKLARELGVDRFQTNPCNVTSAVSRETLKKFVPVGQNAISRINYIDYARKTVAANSDMDSPYCQTPAQNPYIQIDGTLQPCCAAQRPGFFMEPRNYEERNEAARWKEEMSLLQYPLDALWDKAGQRDFRLSALKNRFSQEACVSCLFPADTLGRLFDGTEIEAPRRPEPSSDLVRIKDLRVEPEYAAYLRDNKLSKDIQYYRESGALSPEAEAVLAGCGDSD